MTTVKQSHELKALQTQREKALAELNAAKDEQKDTSKKVNDLLIKVKTLEGRIRGISEKAEANGDIVISEHAYLRYFTRVLGFDLEEVKKEMISPLAEAAIKQFKSGLFPGNGFKLKVKDNKVITLITDDE